MSNAIFPSLAGLTWDVVKAPRWNTKVQQSVGGKETRAQFFSTPIYRWQLRYELLRASALLELQTLIGFFNARQGKFDSFLFSDPSDNTVTQHGFGVGDGVKTAFQLQRSLAGPRTMDWQGSYPTYTTPRTNLYLYSEQLDNAAWTKGNSTIAPNVVAAPDGTYTADTLVETAANGQHYVLQSWPTPIALNAQVTASVHAQYAGRDFIWIDTNDKAGLNRRSYVNVRTGALGTCDSGHTVVVTPLPGGWFRIAVTVSAGLGSTAPNCAFGPATADLANSYVGDPSKGISAWGLQLELGSAATRYVATTSATVIVSPAYWPVAGDAFEPVSDVNGPPTLFRTDAFGTQQLYPTQRRNSCLQSRDLTLAPWANTSAATGNVSLTYPGLDGTPNSATVLADTDAVNIYGRYQSVTIPNDSATHVARFWVVKDINAARFPALEVTLFGGTTPVQRSVHLNTVTGAIATVIASGGTSAARVIDALGWWIVEITCTNNATGNVQLNPAIYPAAGSVFGTNNGTIQGGCAVGQIQVELNAAVGTTPIFTAAAAVTITDYSLSATGLVTLAAALAGAAYLTWSGSYYWRVRFDQDVAEFNNFLYQLWELKQLALVSVK